MYMYMYIYMYMYVYMYTRTIQVKLKVVSDVVGKIELMLESHKGKKIRIVDKAWRREHIKILSYVVVETRKHIVML